LRFLDRDTGPGVATKDRERIFKAFEQVDSSTSRAYDGSGLGLAICDGLVKAMGGTIRVGGEPGSGSTFAFELLFPRGSAMPEPEPEPEVLASDLNFAGSHVLVAEDNPLSRELIREMVADLGCAVDVAADGAEALERARSVVYDLILLDIQMPRLDGLCAARALRALPEHAHTPILAITANAFVEDREQCLAAGMNGHLHKPVTRATLATELSNWLAQTVAPDKECGTAVIGDRPCAAGPGLSGRAMLAGDSGRADSRQHLHFEFVRLHGTDIARLWKHLADGDREAARQLLHTLEGSAAMIGARRLEAAVSRLAAALRAGEAPAVCEPLAANCDLEFHRLAADVAVGSSTAPGCDDRPTIARSAA
jgi:CheY-like chemotaxis protein